MMRLYRQISLLIVSSVIALNAYAATGGFLYPRADLTINGNLLVVVNVSEPAGLASVYLRYNGQEQRQYLCNSSSACGGTRFYKSTSGLNPGTANAIPGQLNIALWVTDAAGNDQLVDTVSVNWQPPVIQGIDVVRSQTGDQINVNWQNSQQVIRYNVYLAAEPGLSRNTYAQLEQGQARLAVVAGPQQFTNLDPATTYYLLVTGITAGGESTLNPEIVVPPLGVVNQPPQAVDDSAATQVDVAVTIDVLSNDSDPDNDVLTISGVGPASGSVVVTPEQTLAYTPAPGFEGQDVFTYDVSDGAGGVSQATVTVTVTAGNQPPVANDDNAETLVDTPIVIDVLANDTDPDGDSLIITDVGAANGDVVVTAEETLAYTPPLGDTGQDIFTYQIYDGNGGVSEATVTVTINLPNQPPDALDDDYQTDVNETLIVDALTGLLANDSDPEGGALTVNTTAVNEPASGLLTLNDDGSFDYLPDADFVGDDTFTYEVEDEEGLTSQADVTITVNPLLPNVEGAVAKYYWKLPLHRTGRDHSGERCWYGLIPYRKLPAR